MCTPVQSMVMFGVSAHIYIYSLSSAGQIVLLQLAGARALATKMVVRANFCAAVFIILVSWSNILGLPFKLLLLVDFNVQQSNTIMLAHDRV
jgi:hypothetical protein